MTKPFLHEVMFILSQTENGHRVTGAHFKMLTQFKNEDGSVAASNTGPATAIDLADPAQLALIEPLNAAVIAELNEVKTQLNRAAEAGQALEAEHNALIVTHSEKLGALHDMTARAADLDRELGHVTRERDEALAREQVLTEAAEATVHDRQALLETMGERSRQITALQAQVRQLQAQLAQAGQQPSATANLS